MILDLKKILKVHKKAGSVVALPSLLF